MPGIETSRVAVGGATLETLWNNDEAKLACAAKDVVVLQEDLPETTRESFRRHAKLWCDHVRNHGAEPVFYAAWAYDRLPAFDDDAICAEHARARKKTTHGSRPSARHARRDQKGSISSTTTASTRRSRARTSPRASSRRRSTAPRRASAKGRRPKKNRKRARR